MTTHRRSPLPVLVFPVLAFAVGLAVGCGGPGGSEKQTSDGGRMEPGDIVHPKYPDVHVEVTGLSRKVGGAIWDKGGDGYRLSTLGASGATFSYELYYAGTTGAGDKYIFDLFIGDEKTKETKEIVYAGKEIEFAATDEVKFILRPGS